MVATDRYIEHRVSLFIRKFLYEYYKKKLTAALNFRLVFKSCDTFSLPKYSDSLLCKMKCF